MIHSQCMRKTIKGVMFSVLMSGAALGLSGCGDEGGSASGEKVIKLGMGSAWKDLVPYNNASGGYYSNIVLGLLYDRLVNIPDSGDPQPRAADSWDVSSDKHSVIFHLNKNAKWSDGKPVTANDFVFAVKMITSPDCAASIKSRMKILKGVDNAGNAVAGETLGAEAVDEYTLKFTTKDPIDPLTIFSQYMFDWFPLPEHAMKDVKPADYLNAEIWQHPVTNGPMKFESQTAGSQLTMTVNKDYHLGAAGFDKMIIQVMAPSNMASALISGDIDIAYPPLSEDDVKTLEASGKVKMVHLKSSSQPYTLYVNQRVYPDKRVRQAMDKAIDREAVVKLIQHGDIIETPIRKDSKYYDASIAAKYDPDTAKKLFESAVADGAISKDEEFVIYTPAGIREKCANIIQQNLQAIGMNAKIQVAEAATIFAGFNTGKTGLALVNWKSSADPMWFGYNLTANPPYWTGITYDLWDGLYLDYLNADDTGKMEVMKRYQKAWVDDVPVIFYASGYQDYGYNPKIQSSGDTLGFEDAASGSIPVWKWSVK